MESNGISGCDSGIVPSGVQQGNTMFDDELEKTLNDNLEQLLSKSIDFR